MQAVTIAFGAASLVGVPLAFGIWLMRRKAERRHRRLSAGRRGKATKIELVGGGEPKADSGAHRRSRKRSRRTSREVIDLFSGKEPPATAE